MEGEASSSIGLPRREGCRKPGLSVSMLSVLVGDAGDEASMASMALGCALGRRREMGPELGWPWD